MRWPINGAHTSLSHYYRSLLRAYARENSLQQGENLHATLLKTGLTASPASFLYNALLHMYASCDLPFSAHKVFEEIPKTYMDTIDWTTLMSCYVRNRLPHHALRLFSSMQQEGIYPDEVTFVSFFNACSRLGDLMSGTQGHLCMIKRGLPFTLTVSNAAMDMYIKCGRMDDGKLLFDDLTERSVVSWSIILSGAIKFEGVEKGRVFFDEMPEKNEVAWTLMIAGYVENGFTREAFLLIAIMLSMHFELNHVTLCSFLSACSQSGDLLMGKWVHVYALKKMEKEMHLMVATALIDMYSKCGRIDIACKVFEILSFRNVVAWNIILSGLAIHGRGINVLELLPRMIGEVKPDDITFVSVLNACSHSGLVDQGYGYFNDLGPRYGITPKIEHYACMIDLLGRAGRLEEAIVFVRNMPIPPNEVVLGSLLAACRLNGKLNLAEHLLQELIRIDPHNTECHVLLSNIYKSAGRQDEADSLRRSLKVRGITKVPGMSSIHVDGQVRSFCSGDKLLPPIRDMYFMLNGMIQKLSFEGYSANTTSRAVSAIEGKAMM